MLNKKITELTKEQLESFSVYRKEWLDIGLSTALADRAEAEEGARLAYRAAGLTEPEMFIWLRSPLEGVIAAASINQVDDQVRAQVSDQVYDQVYDQVRAQVFDQVFEQVDAQVNDQVDAQVRAQVSEQASKQVFAQVSKQVLDQVFAQVFDQVRDQVSEQVNDKVEAQVRDQVDAQVFYQVYAQVRDQVYAQVRDQVGKQVDAQVRDQVRDQVDAQVSDQVFDQVSDQVRDQVLDQVYAQVDAQVDAQVRDQVLDQVYAQVDAQVDAQVRDQVFYQVYAQVRDQVYAQVRDQVHAQVHAQVRDQVYKANYGLHDAGWLSFYATMGNLGVDVSSLHGTMKIARSAGWWWAFNKVVIFTERPNLLCRNEQNQLHNETGPALRYPDGFSIYAWHGVRVPRHWIEDRATLDPREVIAVENVEQRAAGAAIVGWPKMLSVLQATVIHDSGNEDMGALIELTLPGLSRPGRFLKARCPRNGLIVEGVPYVSDIDNLPIDTALAAQAWRIGDPQAEYIHPPHRT